MKLQETDNSEKLIDVQKMLTNESEEEFVQEINVFNTIERTFGGVEETANQKPSGDEENYDDEPEETVMERISGLAEMFPEPLRNFSSALVGFTTSTVKGLYKFSCNASWIFFTSSVILFAPVIFETERAQMEEMQKTQQKQVLLGPGSAMTAVGSAPELPQMR